MEATTQGSSAFSAHHFTAKALLVGIYAGWFLALAIGILAYEGEPILVKMHELPLRHFDWLFRRAGPLILFAAWALRAVTKHILHAAGDGRRDNIWIPAALYTAQASIRSAIYELHRTGFIFTPARWASPESSHSEDHPPHVMSDHVLLAATVVGGLACEAALVYLSIAHRRHRISPIALKVCAAVATILALLVCGETYYTARYFHPPNEIIAGALLGLVLFQAPMLVFSVRALRAQESKAGTVQHKMS